MRNGFGSWRNGFTLVELLVVIAIISIIASLVVAGIAIANDRASALETMNRLRSMHLSALAYAQQRGAFPIAPGSEPRAHESLNVLLGSRFGADLTPDVFATPVGEATQAAIDGDALPGVAGFRLAADNLDFTWVRRRTRLTDRGLLSSNKFYDGFTDADGPHRGHRGYLMAVEVGGKVRELEISDVGENGIPDELTR